AGVQARCLQGQSEESGETEDRGEDIGLTIAEPCTGRRQVNADRTAEQRLGDPGAGLRGHDSRLLVITPRRLWRLNGKTTRRSLIWLLIVILAVIAVCIRIFGPVIAFAGILVVAGPVVVSVARGAVVLTAFVLGIGVLVLVLLVVVIRLLGRLLVRGLVLGVVAVAAVAARTAVAAARGAGLGC